MVAAFVRYYSDPAALRTEFRYIKTKETVGGKGSTDTTESVIMRPHHFV